MLSSIRAKSSEANVPSTPAVRIFVSYARSDALESSRYLRNRLEMEGFSLWQDLVAMEGGRDWWTQIDEAIRAPSIEHLVLLVTPAALERPTIKREVRLARQEGVQVSPVKGLPNLSVGALPRWLGHVYDLDYPEQWHRLIEVLRAPSTQRRVPFMAPEMPEGFVPRVAEYESVKAKLLDARGDAVGITAALRGAGGYGKTALANVLCHDADLQEAFFDGILRVELGERPNDPLGLISDLIKMITGRAEGFNTIGAAGAKLAEVLGERRFLMVIDDAWREQDLKPFLQGGPNTARLVTTRMDDILPARAQRVVVDAMKGQEALELLSRGLPEDQVIAERARLQAISARLGEWPLLLTLVNGFLRERVIRGGEPLVRSIEGVRRRLEARGVVAFDARDAEARNVAVARTIGVSLELLAPTERDRFRDLAVFPEDADVPIGIIARLWREVSDLDEIDTEDLLQRLLKLSLLLTLELDRRTCRLHDVVRAYLQHEVGREALSVLNRKLICALRESEKNGLTDPAERDYFYLNLPMHLAEAGDQVTLDGLLLDPAWMRDKLTATSPQLLLADYSRFGHGRAHDVVRRTLDLITSMLARDPSQLEAQLLGRLGEWDDAGIATLLRHLRGAMSSALLVPQRPTFRSPGASLRCLEGHGMVYTIAVLDARRVFTGSHDNTLRLCDVETGEVLRRFQGHEDTVYASAVLDAGRLISGSGDKTVRLWEIETGQELCCLQGHNAAVWAVAVIDERHIVSGSADMTLRLWDVTTGRELRRFTGHLGGITTLAVVDPRRLVSGSGDKSFLPGDSRARDRILRLWDLETGQELRRFEGHDGGINAVAVLNGRWIISASQDTTLRLWDVETGQERRRFEGHFNPVLAVATLSAQRIISGSADHTVRLWDVQTGHELRRLTGHSGWVQAVAALDGQRIISGSHDLRLWDIGVGEDLRRLKGHDHWVGTVAPVDSRRFISGSWDKTIRLWDIDTGEELRRFEGHSSWIWGGAVLSEQRFISSSADGTLRLWDIETGKELRRFEGHEDKVFAVAAVDPRQVISGSADRNLRLWDIGTARELRRFEGHDDAVCAVVALDDRRIISGSSDRTLRLWDIETCREMRRFEGHGDTVWKLAVLDAQHVISGSFDTTLRLWNIDTGTELRRFEGHSNAIRAIAVLEARYLISGAHDGTLRLWDIAIGRELARLEGDAAFTAIAVLPGRRTIIAGDAIGQLHWIDVRQA
jgi:WD40 repeat protein